MTRLVLVADVGGTKTDLAVIDPQAGPRAPVVEGQLRSADYPSLADLVATFVRESGASGIDHAAFAVAGPVEGGRATITNLGWDPEEGELAHQLGLRSVRLLNDLEAIATAIPELRPDELETLLPGAAVANGPVAVVAPGTGLGEAYLLRTDGISRAHASEGGHSDFGPADAEQAELWRWCSDRFGHVSYERVCSGIGLPNLYGFVCDSGRAPRAPRVDAALAAAHDATPAICALALQPDPDPACAAAVALFVRILAQESGNMALRVLATGGVFLAGGLVRRLGSLFEPAAFAGAFRHKGRLGEVLASVPVSIVVAERVALLGAAVRGLEEAS